MKREFRKFFVYGSGVGIEVGLRDLRLAVLQARPKGVQTLGEKTIERFRERPAAEWGIEYQDWLKGLGLGHLAAWVVLPREEVIVRTVSFPGVGKGDLPAAIGFQLDSLHPYGEETETSVTWIKPGPGAEVLLGITRREVVDRYAALFSEAGIKVAALTFSAAVIRAAARMYADPPAEFCLCQERESGIELYGESASRPMYSALMDAPRERAIGLATAELRVPPETEPLSLLELAPSLPPTLAHAAALNGACPWFGTDLNLLPEALRSATSRARYLPTLVLGGLLLVLFVAVLVQPGYENRRYVKALESETRKLEPAAAKVKQLDVGAASMRARTKQLDDFRLQTRRDMDALDEITKILAPPSWLSSLELNQGMVQIGGEAEQAAALLKQIDSSPLFENSEFTIPLARMQTGEAFRIRAQREGRAPR